MSILDENKRVEFLQGWIVREARWWARRWTLTRRWTLDKVDNTEEKKEARCWESWTG